MGLRRAHWTGSVDSRGYVAITIQGVRKHEHVWVAEQAIGRELPQKARVHHVNENRSDNRPENLVICQSQSYHLLLHRRAAALAASGNADFIRCRYCRKWSDQGNLILDGTRSFAHGACRRAARRAA